VRRASLRKSTRQSLLGDRSEVAIARVIHAVEDRAILGRRGPELEEPVGVTQSKKNEQHKRNSVRHGCGHGYSLVGDLSARCNAKTFDPQEIGQTSSIETADALRIRRDSRMSGSSIELCLKTKGIPRTKKPAHPGVRGGQSSTRTSSIFRRLFECASPLSNPFSRILCSLVTISRKSWVPADRFDPRGLRSFAHSANAADRR
jgi:hypothetical protein